VQETHRKERASWKLDLEAGDGRQIELCSFPNPPKRVTDPEAAGLRHVAFEVTDLEDCIAELASKGVVCEPIRIDSVDGTRMTFFRDPDDLPLELRESAATERPKVGLGVMIFKDGKILLGKRMNAHGEGEYAFPGGHLEHLESIVGCAERETMEETGVTIGNVRFLRLLNLKTYAPRHYVHLTMAADWVSGEPQVLEPEKCEGWDWYALDAMPSPLFATVKEDLEALKFGRNFYDA
jgi:8-oxo-dGTP diphosphatase